MEPRLKEGYVTRLVLTDYYSGPGRALGRLCVSLCLLSGK